MDSAPDRDLNHPAPTTWWKHRRRLAYWAMAALSAMALAAMMGAIKTETIPLLETLAWVFGVVIVSYFGGNAAETFANKGPTR